MTNCFSGVPQPFVGKLVEILANVFHLAFFLHVRVDDWQVFTTAMSLNTTLTTVACGTCLPSAVGARAWPSCWPISALDGILGQSHAAA